ncbi:hypothetical protein DACRYDRAFT_55422 [Dacryopinax primogenitus]|uniref:TLC domain-containing protein n=1 Tax=Dacryopinax primogenitus (strain DJM 731) TaxID=1858805 RepID=M5G1L0_DACPD|nr:uncharacterized protein DACRYDRAFT_55422 [Dacryopinax primogenitus]EJT99731.1 hypothetical protein DACRYDRAFT_55422 [Dacryopinax primogenitus]
MESPILAAIQARVWPVIPSHLVSTFWATFVATPIVYLILAQRYRTGRQRAWIATGAASGCMTITAVPFFWDWLSNGCSLTAVDPRWWLSERVCAGFMGYLVSDLITGSIFYSAHISLVMGWIHHIIYFILLSYVIAQRWSFIFCLGAMMELPTNLLALATLEPALRNDYFFAASFFTLRIAYHILLIVQFALPSTRVEFLGNKPGMGQWGPLLFFCLALPMHVIWFYGCVKGIIRRSKQKKEAALKATSEAAETIKGTQTPGAEKLLDFPPAAARAVGLPTPSLTPYASPLLRPLPVPISAEGGKQLTPPETPTTDGGLNKTPSELVLPNLYVPKEEVRRRLGKELREAAEDTVLRATGYANGAVNGNGTVGNGNGVKQGGEEAKVEDTEGVEESERRRSEIEVY